MPNKKALYIGGCKATYHQIEPTLVPIISLLQDVGFDTTVSGIFHPNGGSEYIGDYSALNAKNLSDFDLLVLFTTGSGNAENVDSILEFVRGGGGLVAIHCAADSFQSRLDYLGMVGGQFRTHPAPLDISVDIVDTQHSVTSGITPFTVFDELYLFKNYDPENVHLLAQTTSYDDGGPIPVAWVREEGKGCVFYISLGHVPDVWNNATWRQFVRNGVTWVVK